MSNIQSEIFKNGASRMVAEVHFKDFNTLKDWLYVDYANSTAVGLERASVHARGAGSKRVQFLDPCEGTLTIELQLTSFRLYSMLAGADVENNAVYAVKKTIRATAPGILQIPTEASAGSLVVYPANEIGNEAAIIPGSLAGGTFTATNQTSIVNGTMYDVTYIVVKSSGVAKVSFKNAGVPKDFQVTYSVLHKSEDGSLQEYKIVAHKASPDVSLDLSFSSDGDPSTVTITLNLLETRSGDFLDIIRI